MCYDPTNPLWQVVDEPYKLRAYNSTTGGLITGAAAEPGRIGR